MRSRTTAGFVLIIGVALACVITALTTLAKNSGTLEIYREMRNVAGKARDAAQQRNWKTSLNALAASKEVRDNNLFLMLLKGERPRDEALPTILWSSQKNHPPLRPPGPRENPTKAQKDWDDHWMGAGMPIGHGMFISVVRSQKDFNEELSRRVWDLVYLGFLVVLLVGVGAWLLVGLTLAPIRKLAQQAATATAEDLHVQLEAPSNDAEVQELVDTLNGFLRRMADTAESKGRFYAAASHELRTPLQALSGHLELALSRPRSAEEYHAALEEAKKQSTRLKSLVQSLLLLHQLENNVVRDKDEVDLAAISQATLQSLRATIESRKLKVEVDLPEQWLIEAIANHAEVLVRNLLENAVKYASAGGLVRISQSTTAEGQELRVFDQCEQIANWTEDKIFEAFYRPDAARNAKTGGNGLGLAICNAIAHADGWKLKVEQVDGGFLAAVQFPSVVTKPAKARQKTHAVA